MLSKMVFSFLFMLALPVPGWAQEPSEPWRMQTWLIFSSNLLQANKLASDVPNVEFLQLAQLSESRALDFAELWSAQAQVHCIQFIDTEYRRYYRSALEMEETIRMREHFTNICHQGFYVQNAFELKRSIEWVLVSARNDDSP